MKELLELRALAFDNAEAIVKLAETEKRSMTKDEMESVRNFHTEIDELDVKIKLQKKQDELRAANTIPVVHNIPAQSKDERKVIEGYSIIKALRSVMDPSVPLTGREKELNDEAKKEQRDVGIGNMVSGGVSIPAMAMRANEQIAGTDAQGGFTVGTELAEVISILRPQTALKEAGARFMTGLVGDLDFTTQDTGVATTWKTEIAALAQGTQTFSQRNFSPNRLGAFVPVSLQLLAQSSIDMENFIKSDIEMAIGAALETAAFSGSGTPPVPLGLIGEIPNLAIGTNGGALDFDMLVDMETAINQANTNGGKVGYIINSATKGQLKKERTDAGSGLFTWANNADLLNGYRAYISNLLPDAGTKGTGTDLSSAIFGNWNDLLVGNWAGMNMIVDPFTKAQEGQVVIVANTFWDILARRLDSFVSVTDIDTAL